MQYLASNKPLTSDENTKQKHSHIKHANTIGTSQFQNNPLERDRHRRRYGEKASDLYCSAVDSILFVGQAETRTRQNSFLSVTCCSHKFGHSLFVNCQTSKTLSHKLHDEWTSLSKSLDGRLWRLLSLNAKHYFMYSFFKLLNNTRMLQNES